MSHHSEAGATERHQGLPPKTRLMAPFACALWRAASGLRSADRTHTSALEVPECARTGAAPRAPMRRVASRRSLNCHGWFVIVSAGGPRSVGLRVTLKSALCELRSALSRWYLCSCGIPRLPPVRPRACTEIHEKPAEHGKGSRSVDARRRFRCVGLSPSLKEGFETNEEARAYRRRHVGNGCAMLPASQSSSSTRRPTIRPSRLRPDPRGLGCPVAKARRPSRPPDRQDQGARRCLA